MLAVTFTARAAGEMRTRLRDLGVGGVQARTFHSAALRQLQFFWPQVVGGAVPSLVTQKAPLVGAAASRLRIQVDRAAVRDLSAEIEWAKVSMVEPDDYPAAAERAGRSGVAGMAPVAVARVLRGYEEVKTDRGVIDFEDVLLLTAGVLEERPDVAATVRGQYRHFVVDEYQDVSGLQQRLLDLWLGDRDDLCVVGDASQTIYSFAGADPQHLLGFRRRYPQAALVKLVRDYRSTPQVVGLANRLLDRAPASARTARVELVAQRPAGPEPELLEHADDVDEAEQVATRIRALVDGGVPAREIAVLYRTNGQSEPLEQALANKGVGYLLRGGERFFQRPEVREAVLLLRGAARGDDGSSALGEATRAVLATAGLVAGAARRAPARCASGGSRCRRWPRSPTTSTVARPGVRLPDLVAELEERAAAQHAPAVEGVTLASLHAAKGLEWDVVAIVGLSEGLVPISFAADSADAVEEERRLLYVGVTRARERLLLSWSRSRTPGGRGSRRPVAVPRRPGAGQPAGRRRRPPGAAASGARRRCTPPAAGAARPCPPRSSARPDAARPARPTTTSSCSRRCASGGPRSPRSRRCRRTWSSPTPRSRRSRSPNPLTHKGS